MQTKIENNEYRDPLYWTYDGLYQTIDAIENSNAFAKKILILEKAIEKYPHYYDFYVILFDTYIERDGEADMNIIKKGYILAIDRLKKENSGKLPEVMNWCFIENRHIHRIIYNYAERLAQIQEYKKSNKLLNTLLRLHPSDSIGARFLKKENMQRIKIAASERGLKDESSNK